MIPWLVGLFAFLLLLIWTVICVMIGASIAMTATKKERDRFAIPDDASDLDDS